MELKDFIVTPILLFIVYAVAYWIRPRVTDVNTRRYFIPALTVKIIGALAVGFIYQFYYSGGDTFAYHTHGSKVIWEAFNEDWMTGINLFLNKEMNGPLFEYVPRIWFYNDPSSFVVIQVAFIFNVLTFGCYSATAILFAVFSFSGIWALYLILNKYIFSRHKLLAIVVLFIPSVVFWGSGILKDTLTIGAICWLIYGFYYLVLKNRWKMRYILILVFSAYLIFSIKIYVLLTLLPTLIIWTYLALLNKTKSVILKVIVAPILFLISAYGAFNAIVILGEQNPKYSLENLPETAKITAYDIGFYTGRNAGSGYTLGELDGTYFGMIELFPSAVNVTLFRPYLWEVNNFLMLLAAVESLIVLIFTFYVIFKLRLKIFRVILKPHILAFLSFSVVLAFAVGVSTFNFGTLMRYKIPLMPFYLSALVFILDSANKDKKLSELEVTE